MIRHLGAAWIQLELHREETLAAKPLAARPRVAFSGSSPSYPSPLIRAITSKAVPPPLLITALAPRALSVPRLPAPKPTTHRPLPAETRIPPQPPPPVRFRIRPPRPDRCTSSHSTAAPLASRTIQHANRSFNRRGGGMAFHGLLHPSQQVGGVSRRKWAGARRLATLASRPVRRSRLEELELEARSGDLGRPPIAGHYEVDFGIQLGRRKDHGVRHP
jgi:hypothetical protein